MKALSSYVQARFMSLLSTCGDDFFWGRGSFLKWGFMIPISKEE